MKRSLLCTAAWLSLTVPAIAQGQIPAGTLWGNPTSLAGLPRAAVPSAYGIAAGVNNVKSAPFNAACDGTVGSNDTAALQAALDAAVINRQPVLIPAGAVCVSGSLSIASGIKLMGEGPTSTLRAHATLINATSNYLLINQNSGSFIDNAITVENLTIDGNNIGAGATQTISHGLIGFGHVTNLVLENIKVYNYSYNCVDLIGVRKARVVNSEFTACGYMDHGVPNNGGSLFIANHGTDQSADVLIEGNYFHDAFGMTFAAYNSVMNGNVFRDMKEIAVNYPGGGALVTRNNIISNNAFDGTMLFMVSGSCIEADTVQLTQFIGNSFRNCWTDGLTLTNTQETLVEGNVFSNMGIQPGWGANSAAIKIHNSNASPNQPQNITISGNRVYDDQVTPTTGSAIQVTYTFGGSTPAINLAIIGNDFSKTAFVNGANIIKENTAGIIGAGSIIRNNLPTTVNRVLPIAEGGTNCFLASGTCLDNITGFSGVGVLSRAGPADYRANTLTGTANEITVTNGTGAAGNPTFSLPTALTFTGKTITGGTFASPTFSGTIAGFPATTCTNQFLSAISAAAVVTCTTDVLASAQHANQGTATTLLHGNAAGNPSWGPVVTADITDGNITYAKIGNLGGLSVMGRSATSSGVGADITGTADQVLRVTAAGASLGFGAIDVSKAAAVTGVLLAAAHPALTGDVTNSAGSLATTIANNVVSNAKLAQMANSTIKCRTTAGTGNAEDCTAAQAAAIIGGVGGAIKSKLITSTRDLTAASANVAYTGVGFVPTSCHANGSVGNNNSYASINGFADSALAGRSLFTASGNISTTANFMAFVDVTGSNSQTATVASYDADGFTLAWTKTGTPTGTATLQFICYR